MCLGSQQHVPVAPLWSYWPWLPTLYRQQWLHQTAPAAAHHLLSFTFHAMQGLCSWGLAGATQQRRH